MITDLLIQFLNGFVTGFLSLFPTYTLPSSLTTMGSGLGTTLGAWNGIVPVTTLAVVALALVALRTFLALMWLLQFVYELIPFKAT